MTSASKFIDFFVHDILDYTILNKDESNFIKDMKVFDIREAINQIITIQEDKASMKAINISVHYFGFDHNSYFVKSD